jgi:hypothetical protein
MTRARVLQEVRQMRFEEVYAQRQRRTLTVEEAAEMLGVTARLARSGRANPCPIWCCTKMARPMIGSPAVSGI